MSLNKSACLPAPKVSTGPPFDSQELLTDLKSRTVRGGAATAATQAGLFLVKCVSVPLLARLLTPADFGLVAMVTVITDFIVIFEDAGLSMATVQRSRITQEQISTLFWVNAALGLGLTVFTAALAPGIAWFYGDHRLVGITLVVASVMLLGALNVQHRALLERQMRFGVLGTIRIISRLAGIMTVVTAALLGAGYWALTFQAVASSCTTLISVWVISGWRPGPPVRGSGVRSMLAFGGSVTGSKLLHYARRNIDNMLIGAVWGAVPLGTYTKAYSLLMLPMQLVHGPIGAVAVPALSRLQDDAERYRRFFRKGTELIAMFAAPVSVFALVNSHELVEIVLGKQWMGSVPVFAVLAPAAFLSAITGGGTWLYHSLGRTRALLRVSMVQTALIVSGIILGLPSGPIGVATGYTLASIPCSIVLLTFGFHRSPVSMSDMFAATWRPGLTALLAGSAAILMRYACAANLGAELRLGLSTASFGAVWMFTSAIVPGSRSVLAEFKDLARAARAAKES